MRRTLAATLWILLFASALASARAASAAGPPAPDDPFAGALFPPELVMLHGDDIGLEPAQRDAIKKAVEQAQPLFLDHQLDLQSELGRLRKVLAPPRVDADAALQHLDRILAIERELKRAQVTLLIRIKNQLSPEQQQRLAELRDGLKPRDGG